MTDWRPVSGFEDRYEVSPWGDVRSLIRSRLLTVALESGRPYRYVTLHCGGRQFHRRVHALVLEAFVGPRPEGLFGLHADDDVTNNTLSNLRWGTRSENSLDMVANGNHNHARKSECKHGHPLSGDNLIVTKRQRFCRACKRRRQAAYDLRRRDALAVLVADREAGP